MSCTSQFHAACCEVSTTHVHHEDPRIALGVKFQRHASPQDPRSDFPNTFRQNRSDCRRGAPLSTVPTSDCDGGTISSCFQSKPRQRFCGRRPTCLASESNVVRCGRLSIHVRHQSAQQKLRVTDGPKSVIADVHGQCLLPFGQQHFTTLHTNFKFQLHVSFPPSSTVFVVPAQTWLAFPCGHA